MRRNKEFGPFLFAKAAVTGVLYVHTLVRFLISILSGSLQHHFAQKERAYHLSLPFTGPNSLHVFFAVYY